MLQFLIIFSHISSDLIQILNIYLSPLDILNHLDFSFSVQFLAKIFDIEILLQMFDNCIILLKSQSKLIIHCVLYQFFDIIFVFFNLLLQECIPVQHQLGCFFQSSSLGVVIFS